MNDSPAEWTVRDQYRADFWNTMLTSLMDARFSYGDAFRWAVASMGRLDGDVAPIAVSYREFGFTAREGVAWEARHVPASLAVIWANAGWTPAQAASLQRFLDNMDPQFSHFGITMFDLAQEPGWLATGIPAHRVLIYEAAGISPDEALGLEARRSAGEDIGPAVAVLAALRPRLDPSPR
jgi:hypothetical protein